MPLRKPKTDFAPVDHVPRKAPKFVPPELREAREREAEIYRMIDEAKKKIRMVPGKKGVIQLDKESRDALTPLLLELRRRQFSLASISKIVKPLFPEELSLEDINAKVQSRISKAELKKGREKRTFGRKREAKTDWRTMDEKHAEALELERFRVQVAGIRSANPIATIGEIAKKTRRDPTKVSEWMKVLYESAGEAKKPLFDTGWPKRKIRKSVFTKEEKFSLVYGEHVGLIRTLVGRILKRHMEKESFNSFVAEVQFRLLEELDLFDPERGAKVNTFIGGRAEGITRHILRERAAKNKGRTEYLEAEKRRILRELENP
jgi:hypothetical protein